VRLLPVIEFQILVALRKVQLHGRCIQAHMPGFLYARPEGASSRIGFQRRLEVLEHRSNRQALALLSDPRLESGRLLIDDLHEGLLLSAR